MKKVSIIIPVFNSQNTIAKCIKTILNNNKNLKKELIVVNDGSTDNTVNILKKIKNIKLINLKKNQGVGYARQVGAKSAKYETLCYVDSDVFVSKNSISKLIDKLYSNNKIATVGGIQKPINLNKKDFSSDFVCLKSCYGFDDVDKEVDFSVIHSEFNVIKKKYLLLIGGWKKYDKAGGEEFELGHRITNSNKKIILIKDAYYVTSYPNLYNRFKEVIERTEKYISILLKKKYFDTKGSFATSAQAISAVITLFYLINLVLFINFEEEISSYIFLLLLTLQLFAEFNFFKYCFKIKGFRMLIFSIFAIQLLNLGIIIGGIKFLIKKIIRI